MHFQQQKSNALVRKELQAHLLAHQQLLAGYTDYIRRHTHALLQLVLNRPQVCQGAQGFLLKDIVVLVLRCMWRGAQDPHL